MRFVKMLAYLASSGFAFTSNFYDRFKSPLPFIVQMLFGWGLFFAATYQLVQGVRELVANAKGKD